MAKSKADFALPAGGQGPNGNAEGGFPCRWNSVGTPNTAFQLRLGGVRGLGKLTQIEHTLNYLVN